MVYNYRDEYTDKVCEGKAKVEQEIVVAKKIMDLLNQNKYDNLEEFIDKNRTLQDFLKNQNLETAVKHFNTNGNPLNEEDYVQILDRIRKITEKKRQIDTSELTTANLDTKQFGSMKIDGKKQYAVAQGQATIEEEMKKMQGESESYQTIDGKQNAENMFKGIKEKQEEVKPIPLNEINVALLTDEEKEILSVAAMYEHDTGEKVKLDVKNALLVTAQNEMLKIKKEDGQLKIIGEDGNEKENTNTNQKTYQKVLTPATDTLHSA